MTHDGTHGLSGPLTPCGPTSPHVLTLLPLLLGYLKLWQLSSPYFTISSSFQYHLFVGRAQDCTPGDKAFGTSVVSNT